MAIVEGLCTSSDGLRLRYVVDGTAADTSPAPPLLCAAGGPGRAADYLGDLGGLTGARAIVRLDTRGTGRSAAPTEPEGYDPERLVDDLERVRLDLGVDTVDLLGHSAGGPIALGYTLAHPERVRRLVLVTTYLDGAGLDDERERIQQSRSAEPWYPEAADAADGMRYARAAELQRLSRLQRPFYYGRWDETVQAHAAAADSQMSPRAEAGIRRAFDRAGGVALAERLGELTPDVLVVAGALDVITPPSGGRRFAGSIPGARFVLLDGVGHFPWVDGADAFAGAVEAFLGATA